MCPPATLLTAVSALSTVVQLYGEGQRQSFNQQLSDANTESANTNALRSYAALQARQREEHARAAQSVEQAHRQALSARSIARAGALESGAGGGILEALDGEFLRTEAEFVSTTIRNEAFLADQFEREAWGVQSNQQAQILQGLPGPSNFAQILVGGLSSGLQAYAIGKPYQP